MRDRWIIGFFPQAKESYVVVLRLICKYHSKLEKEFDFWGVHWGRGRARKAEGRNCGQAL